MFEVTIICLCIAAVLAYINHRWVGLPMSLAERGMCLPRGAGKVLTWGGLRGGISVALALTYGVVIFSMLGQGLTIGRVIEKSIGTMSNIKERV